MYITQHFRIFHQNTRSLQSKLNHIEVLIDSLNPDLLLITEHWSNDNVLECVKFKNGLYTLASSFSRNNKKGGGAAIFIKNNITFQVLDFSKFCVEGLLEAAGITTKIDNETYIIICIYRPPISNIDSFLSILSELVDSLSSTSNCVLMGDFNVDILVQSDHKHKLLNFLNEFNLVYLINQATRITQFSQSALDNIIINRQLFLKHVIPNVIVTGLSDHYGILFDIPNKKSETSQNKCNNFIKKRSFNNENLQTLTFLLQKEKWDALASSLCVNDQYTIFSDILNYYLDICCPLQIKSVMKIKIDRIPWLNKEVTDSKNKLIFLESLWVQCRKNLNLKKALKMQKQIYENLLKSTKAKYMTTKILNSKNVNCDTWKIVNSDLGRCAKRNCNISLKKIILL